MDKKERKSLIQHLIYRIKAEKEIESKFRKGEIVKTITKYNPEYLTDEERFQILGLKNFMQLNPDLTDEEIKEVLLANPKKFKFLLECEKKYKGFFDLIRYHCGLTIDRIPRDRRSDEVLNRKLP